MLKYRDQTRLARAVGISPSFVNDILRRRRTCPQKRAYAMSLACYKLFKVVIEPQHFVFNDVSREKLFKPLTEAEIRKNEEARYAYGRPECETEPA